MVIFLIIEDCESSDRERFFFSNLEIRIKQNNLFWTIFFNNSAASKEKITKHLLWHIDEKRLTKNSKSKNWKSMTKM